MALSNLFNRCFGNHQTETNPLKSICALWSFEDHWKHLQCYWVTPLLHTQPTKEQLYSHANFCIPCSVRSVAVLFTGSAAQRDCTNIRDGVAQSAHSDWNFCLPLSSLSISTMSHFHCISHSQAFTQLFFLSQDQGTASVTVSNSISPQL